MPFETAVRLRFDRFHGFVEQYSANLSLGGMFIRSDEPPPLGTDVAVEFRLEDGFELIRGRGRVAWVREAAPGGEPGGFGLRFLELTPGSRELIFRLVERRVREGDRVFDLDDAAPPTAASRLVHDEERLASPPWDLPSPRGGDEAARGEGGAAAGEMALYGRAAREAAEGEEGAGAGPVAVEGPVAAGDPEASFAGLVEADEEAAGSGGRPGPIEEGGEPGPVGGEGEIGEARARWAPATEAGGGPGEGGETAGGTAAAAGRGATGGAEREALGAADLAAAAGDDGETRRAADRAGRLAEGGFVAGAATAATGAAADAPAPPGDGGRAAAAGEAGATDRFALSEDAPVLPAEAVPAGGDAALPRDLDAPAADRSPSTGWPADPEGRASAVAAPAAVGPLHAAREAAVPEGGTDAAAAPPRAPEPWPEPVEATGHGFAGAGHAGAARRRGRLVGAIAAAVAVLAVGGFLLFRVLAASQANGDDSPAAAAPGTAAADAPAAGGAAEGEMGAGEGEAGAAPDAAGRRPPADSPSSPAEALAPFAETGAPPPPASGPPTVERIEWRRRDGGLDFEITGGRPIAAAQVDDFRLGGERPRLVVRIAGIERPYARGEIAVGGPLVERVRTGFHPAAGEGGGSLQVVFDLASADARAAVDAAGGGVRVRIEGP